MRCSFLPQLSSAERFFRGAYPVSLEYDCWENSYGWLVGTHPTNVTSVRRKSLSRQQPTSYPNFPNAFTLVYLITSNDLPWIVSEKLKRAMRGLTTSLPIPSYVYIFCSVPSFVGKQVASYLQGSAKRWSLGLVNFVTALAYHFCSIHATWGPPFSRSLLHQYECCVNE